MSFKNFLNEGIKLKDKDILPLKNDTFGFWGTLLTNDFSDKEVNDKYREIAKELAKNWGITDPVTLQKLFDSKVGRWLADSIAGMDNQDAKDIAHDVFRTKEQAMKMVKKYTD